MSIKPEHFTFLTDMMKEGLIFIDDQAKIVLYHKKAREIFGIDNRLEARHDSGRVQKGDFVIIADNCIGKDDGGLEPADLNKLGINGLPEGLVGI